MIYISELSKTFSGQKVLNNLSLEIQKGENGRTTVRNSSHQTTSYAVSSWKKKNKKQYICSEHTRSTQHTIE